MVAHKVRQGQILTSSVQCFEDKIGVIFVVQRHLYYVQIKNGVSKACQPSGSILLTFFFSLLLIA